PRHPSISQTNESNFLFCSQYNDRPSFRVVDLLFRWCVLLGNVSIFCEFNGLSLWWKLVNRFL
ncbi:hypothetical protein SFRURICE_010598, partial [Spodoptera frugiperda]